MNTLVDDVALGERMEQKVVEWGLDVNHEKQAWLAKRAEIPIKFVRVLTVRKRIPRWVWNRVNFVMRHPTRKIPSGQEWRKPK